MRTLGIDLAAQAKGTYLCELLWGRDVVEIVELRGNEPSAPDDDLRDQLTRSNLHQVGVDVPFGWPDAFVALMKGTVSARSWRDDAQTLRFRMTDIQCCKELLAKEPLSVAMDKIAAPAMRWRVLTSVITDAHTRQCEVYPAAALKYWKLPCGGYKNTNQTQVRRTIIAGIRSSLPLALGPEHNAILERNADGLDALIAALVARAVAIGRTRLPREDQQPKASREGWIHIPTCSLAELCA